MRIGTLAAGLAIVGACAGAFVSRRSQSAPLPAPGARVAVVVELFSSEGCSSCPPADAYLASLDRAQPIEGVTVLALEEHVDYWDRLGWKDPFGSPAFSDRQAQYARVLADHHVFTPEIVFDGQSVMPGGDEDAARKAMQGAAREPKARVTLRRDGERLSIDVVGATAPSDDVAEVWLALTESGLVTDVPAGENKGRRLAHAPVVRSLRSVGAASAGGVFHGDASLHVEPSWKTGAIRAAVFVQLAGSRKIVGAAAL